MSDFKDLQVGDTVWLEDRSPSYRNAPERQLIEAKVVKVGRQYFYANAGSWHDRKIHKEDGWEFVGPNDNGHYKWRAWRYKEHYEQWLEEGKGRAKLEAFFRNHSKLKQLSHQQVKVILNIIEP